MSVLLLLAFAGTAYAQPSFIVVLGDDVGWDAFGCTGMREARTPAIDQLARESCMMKRFYCSVSQCAPLRAELYTGLLPNHNGVLANATRVKRPGVKNVADHLRPHYGDTLAARQAVAKHAAEVEVLDHLVRETRDMMKSMDLDEDTILVFLSEQGPTGGMRTARAN